MRYVIIYIFFLLSNIINAQQEFAWVYFNDKQNVDYLVNNPELILSDLSILKKQSKGIPIDYKDVPINNDYIQIISDLDNLSVYQNPNGSTVYMLRLK